MMPVGAELLVKAGHEVRRRDRRGRAAADFPTRITQRSARRSWRRHEEIFAKADMIVKVKEPQPQEIGMFRPGQIVFTYFHFAADEELTQACLEAEIVAIAYETIKDKPGRCRCSRR